MQAHVNRWKNEERVLSNWRGKRLLELLTDAVELRLDRQAIDRAKIGFVANLLESNQISHHNLSIRALYLSSDYLEHPKIDDSDRSPPTS